MWWWTKIRTANIPNHVREMFEVYGETMVTMVLALRPEERLCDLTIEKHLGDALAYDGRKLDVASPWRTFTSTHAHHSAASAKFSSTQRGFDCASDVR
jgi:hypothetical protein